jgi:hypothetical protein
MNGNIAAPIDYLAAKDFRNYEVIHFTRMMSLKAQIRLAQSHAAYRFFKGMAGQLMPTI